MLSVGQLPVAAVESWQCSRRAQAGLALSGLLIRVQQEQKQSEDSGMSGPGPTLGAHLTVYGRGQSRCDLRTKHPEVAQCAVGDSEGSRKSGCKCGGPARGSAVSFTCDS